jgi:hypothetical protein
MACSTSRGKVATILGASEYPGQTDVRARGTTVSPTARPAYVVVFCPERLVLGGYHPHVHASWCPAGHAQLTRK